MGSDIKWVAQRRVREPVGDKDYDAWQVVDVPTLRDDDGLGCRTYGRFAFLCGWRNYSNIKPIDGMRGAPSDFYRPIYGSGEFDDRPCSWLSMDELEAFDYSRVLVDERVGGAVMTYRKYLGVGWFEGLAECRAAGVDRLVFGFDC